MIATKWFSGGVDLADAFAVRRAVFIAEQGIPEGEEFDAADGVAAHAVLYEDGEPVATGRVYAEGGECLLGRVCVLKAKRGLGYGDAVVRMLIRKAYALGHNEQHIHAQLTARAFYEKLGFEAYGEEFFEAGIAHIRMKRTGDVGGDCGA